MKKSDVTCFSIKLTLSVVLEYLFPVSRDLDYLSNVNTSLPGAVSRQSSFDDMLLTSQGDGDMIPVCTLGTLRFILFMMQFLSGHAYPIVTTLTWSAMFIQQVTLKTVHVFYRPGTNIMVHTNWKSNHDFPRSWFLFILHDGLHLAL